LAQLVEMPKLSDTMVTGRLVSWLLNEGDATGTDKPIAEVETDKATMELECEEEGVLLRQLAGVEDAIPVGAPIAIIGAPGEDISSLIKEAEKKRQAAEESARAILNKPKPAPSARPADIPPNPITMHAPESTVDGESQTGVRKASPIARKMAEEHGIDLDKITGSGPAGKITQDDVEKHIK